MKTGDTLPPWRIAIEDSDQVTDLNVVESWRFVARLSGTVIFTDLAPTVDVGDNVWSATMSHTWLDGETDMAGCAYAEIVATWPGGEEQTFPAAGQPRPSIVIAPSID